MLKAIWRRLLLAATLALTAVLLFTACPSKSSDVTTPAPVRLTRRVPPPPAATEAEAQSRIQAALSSFDLADSDTLNRVRDLVEAGRLGIPTVAQELRSPQTVRRWAAIYALGSLAQPQDAAAVRPALADTNATVRALAAGTLLRLGSEEGLAALRQAAASEEVEAFSEPPRLLRDYAQRVLAAFGKTALPPAPLSRAGLMRPLPAPLEKTDVAVKDGGVVITVNIEVDGDGVTDALIESWRKGIEAMWSGNIAVKPAVSAKVVANIRKLSKDDLPSEGYHYVTVAKVPPGGTHRSSVSKLPAAGESVTGAWADIDSPEVAAHEVGHLLGIDDEYEDTAARGSRAKPEFARDNESDPSIMVQTWSSGRKRPHAKERHSVAVLKALGFDPAKHPEIGATPTAIPTPTRPPTATATRLAPTATRSATATTIATPAGKAPTTFKYVLRDARVVGCKYSSPPACVVTGTTVRLNARGLSGITDTSTRVLQVSIGTVTYTRTPAQGEPVTATITWPPFPQEIAPGTNYDINLTARGSGPRGVDPGPVRVQFCCLQNNKTVWQFDREVIADAAYGRVADGDYLFRVHPDFVARSRQDPALLRQLPATILLGVEALEQ